MVCFAVNISYKNIIEMEPTVTNQHTIKTQNILALLNYTEQISLQIIQSTS